MVADCLSGNQRQLEPCRAEFALWGGLSAFRQSARICTQASWGHPSHCGEGCQTQTVRTHAVALTVLLVASGCGGSSDSAESDRNAQMVLALEATTTSAPAETQTESSSLGFDVSVDGWGFQNYVVADDRQFQISDAVALFGAEAVCVDADGDCVATATATEWISMVAASMTGGICEGMTVGGLDLFLVGDDAATSSVGLTDELHRYLTRLYATQFLGDVIEETSRWRERSVSDIVTELKAALADRNHEQYTLGLYTKGGGHSVLPHAVAIESDGYGLISVYDPNWPNQQRYVEVDVENDLWRFSYDSPDPGADPAPWTGGNGTLDLTPLSVREAPFPEPFTGAGTGKGVLLAVTSTNQGWTVTSGDGQVASGDDLLPGNEIVASVRGAFGATTTLVRVSEGVLTVETSDDTRVAVQTSTQMASLESLEGVTAVLTAGQDVLGVSVAEGPGAQVSITAANSRVEVLVPAAASGQIEATSTETTIKVTDTDGNQIADLSIPIGDTRQELRIDQEGGLREVQPLSAPEEVRAVSLGYTPVSTQAETTTTTIPVVSTTVETSPASTTTSPATTTTKALDSVPTTTTQTGSSPATSTATLAPSTSVPIPTTVPASTPTATATSQATTTTRTPVISTTAVTTTAATTTSTRSPAASTTTGPTTTQPDCVMDPSTMTMPEGFALPEEGIPEGYVPPSDMELPDGAAVPGC